MELQSPVIKFGTDGIRGAANVELTTEVTMLIGKCAAYALSVNRKDSTRRILVAKDTRVSGDMLESALMAGICSVGVEAWKVGVVPTPALAFLTKSHNCDCGIMISASHNPVEDNGIKLFSNEGYKLDQDAENEIETLMAAGGADVVLPTGDKVGCKLDKMNLAGTYASYVRRIMRGAVLDGGIVIDCAYGAASKLAKRVFQDRADRVVFLHSDEDGRKINVECGSTRPKKLQQKVVKNGAALGFAFDGDADRCIFVDEKGNVVDGDQIMMLCARDMQARGELSGNTLVSTVMSNMGLEKALAENSITMLRTPVGDKYVLREMLSGGYDLGGEQSGHVIFRRLSTTGDGLITAACVLGIVARAQRPFSELIALERSAQVLKNVRVPDKEAFYNSSVIDAKVKEVEQRLGADGRVLVRPSGTEPKVRVMVETWDQDTADKYTDEIINTVKQELEG